jgi:glutamate formiminotransferase
LLIAFNVFLLTSDVTIAQEIARQIRAANGGYTGVKALGLLVDGRAQVSMNITQVWAVWLADVVADIQRQARAAGTDIDRSELIGLIPWRALTEGTNESSLLVAAKALHLRDFVPERVLEVVLRAAGYAIDLL